MKTHLNPSRFRLLCVTLIALACGVVLPTAAPTAPLPPAGFSPLEAQLGEHWKVINGGSWEGAALFFGGVGTFNPVNALQVEDAEGVYFFTAENTIAFRLPGYQGIIALEITDGDINSMTVGRSDEIEIIYSVERGG